MKNKLFVLLVFVVLSCSLKAADTLVLNSKIKDVTVFFDGAQISREAKVNLLKGKHILTMDKLPAEINPQSIQIVNNLNGEILSVKHELVYPRENSKTKKEYDDKIKQQEILFKEIDNKIKVYEIEEKILLDNSLLNKKETGTTIAEIKEASVFYRDKLNEIRKNKLKLTIELEQLKETVQDLYKELNQKMVEENKVYSKVTIAVDSKSGINAKYKINYFVSSAGWTPLYDFRVNKVSEPLNIIYNANIFQSTGEDWKSVNLTLSTSEPSLSNTKPELDTWYINRPGSYRRKSIKPGQSALKGMVVDKETGEPMPYANVVVLSGTETVAGAMTDFDGRYNIKPIKSGTYSISVSYIGFNKLEMRGVILNANRTTTQDFELVPGAEMLEEVAVMEYKKGLFSKSEEIAEMPGRKSYDYEVDEEDKVLYFVDGYESESNITSLEYKIDVPYTIPADGKDYLVKIKEARKPVEYNYYAIPKLENEVFLTASIDNWTQLNLLSGRTSIYYKGTFTGESEIDAGSIDDTLEISLSRDKNIIVERTSLKEKNEKRFIGKNVKELMNWSIVVKNNKNEKIKLFVEDQFPVSENNLVEIERIESSSGKVDEKTGKVTWELELEPNEKKELSLIYSVKYPNYMNIVVE